MTRTKKRRSPPARGPGSAEVATPPPADTAAIAPAPAVHDAPREPWHRRLRGVLQVEDVALFAWLLALETGLGRFFGADLHAVATGGSAPRWLLWTIGLAFAAVFYTRGPEDVDLDTAVSRRCVLGVLVFFAAKRYLADDGSWFGLVLLWMLLVVVAVAPLQAALPRLPYTGLALRRTLVLPAVLLGNTVFVTQIGPQFLSDPSFDTLDPALRLPAKVGLSGLLFLYTVVGPRAMAGGPWNPLFWTLRFGWYLLAHGFSGRAGG